MAHIKYFELADGMRLCIVRERMPDGGRRFYCDCGREGFRRILYRIRADKAAMLLARMAAGQKALPPAGKRRGRPATVFMGSGEESR